MKASRVVLLCISCLLSRSVAIAGQGAAVGGQVTVSEGSVTIPTYEHTGRELEPPLFPESTVKGLYPFTTYLTPFQEGDPKPRAYAAIFVENEYLKLTYLPELGGRFFSLYDKLRNREVFYRNDVIKPSMFNPRDSWSTSGIELTGPYDAHMLTLHGEPYWSHTTVRHEDGSISLVLGEVDPIYHMTVNLSATLHPGIAALEIGVFCYNGNDGQMPQMFWTNAGLSATPKTQFIYPMTRTVGHTTGEVSDWPLYNGIDYSWDRNNKHMLGVFGIDSYDNFAGAYQFDKNYGVFRYADRRLVQGMKLWTFGYGPEADNVQKAYTDNAGPYVEVQSGRHVWDGHYEYVAPHKHERWSEWWIPVGGTGGITTLTRDVALNLTVVPDAAGQNTEIHVALSPTRVMKRARLVVKDSAGELMNTEIDLVPGVPVATKIAGLKAKADVLKGLIVHIADAEGVEVLDYTRPDENPGRKQYSPAAKELERPQKPVEQMSVEELVDAAEFKLKEMNPEGMQDLVDRALKLDPGYSRAHLLLGVNHFNHGRYRQAADELAKATERDPYLGEGWYYLAMSQLALGDSSNAERTLYFIEPESGYFGPREYQLGKLAFIRSNLQNAEEHLERAVQTNGYDIDAHSLYALTLRLQRKKEDALRQLTEAARIDHANVLVTAERFFLAGDPAAKYELLQLLGDQSQEALTLALFYEGVHRWREAVEVLRMVDGANKDPWGTSPLFYYTLAYDLEQSGDAAQAAELRKRAQSAVAVVDRFPARAESEAPLRAAIRADANDVVARFNLACLLYFLERPDEAIAEWRSAVAIDPRNFSSRRALGLAYAAQGKTDLAAEQLEAAIDLKPDHVRTLNDLSSIYARAGRFDDQIALLNKALQRSPDDDDLVLALLNAYLIKGRYQDADRIITTHTFAPRHRENALRDEYRSLRYGMGAVAFNQGDYAHALALFQSVLKPPASLGIDTFQFQSTPRAYYYIGRTLDALGRKQEAAEAYRQSTSGIDFLTGDRDSWNSENFFAVLSLEKLGDAERARQLAPHFAAFAKTEMDEVNPAHRGQARFMLGLIAKHDGQREQALQLMNDSLQALPDLLQPRFELRGDVLDPLKGNKTN
jgi:tetratricopeptide (TPR) repeat protein